MVHLFPYRSKINVLGRLNPSLVEQTKVVVFCARLYLPCRHPSPLVISVSTSRPPYGRYLPFLRTRPFSVLTCFVDKQQIDVTLNWPDIKTNTFDRSDVSTVWKVTRLQVRLRVLDPKVSFFGQRTVIRSGGSRPEFQFLIPVFHFQGTIPSLLPQGRSCHFYCPRDRRTEIGNFLLFQSSYRVF